MHEQLMRQMIEAASRTSPHPNPRVGAAVITADGNVVGTGVHDGPGHKHAEVIALEVAGSAAAGGTMIVSLEPCNHHGRTPPCTDAIAESGIARVVVGALDPDRRVNGGGVETLRAAGVEVETGMLADEVEAMDAAYFHHRRTGRPRVTLKLALTLDGQMAAADGTSQWITGEEARRDAHLLRAGADAVIVGAGTVRQDDPRLDVRLDGYSGPQPTPVIVAGHEPLPEATVFERGPIVIAPGVVEGLPEAIVLAGPDGVDLEKALLVLADLGKLDLLVEGGGRLAGSLIDQDLVDRFVFYLGARLAGGSGINPLRGVFGTFSEAVDVEVSGIHRLGPDVKIEFRRV
jgi:diaminohydroxyphosphoribosylaminopyrimidine deaminase/5-amino-6-(5-phosphoribosylamino)uracil reductase